MTKRIVATKQKVKVKGTAKITGSVPFQTPIRTLTLARGPPNKRSNVRKSTGPPPFVVAKFDPFNPEAFGVKVPDENQTPSYTFYSRYNVAPTTDGTYGSSAALFMPDPTLTYVLNASATAATTVTWPATYGSAQTVPNIATIKTNIELLRPVSWGIRASALQSFTNAQGKIHFCLVPIDFAAANTSWASFTPTTVAAMKEMPGYTYVPTADLIQDDMLCVGKTFDASSYRYRSSQNSWFPGTTPPANIETAYGWFGILAFIEGAGTSVTPIDFDVIIHYEGISKAAGGLYDATPPAAYQPAIMAATTNITEVVPSSRVVDNAGVAEASFMDKLTEVWDGAVTVATGVASAVGWGAKIAAMFL